MKKVDVVKLTQEAVAQTMGADYMSEKGGIKAIESFRLADIGEDVLNSGTVDQYVKSILTQLGKMYVDSKAYAAELPSLFIDSFEWGGYLERVYFKPQDLIQDEMYNLVDGNTYEDHKFYQPKASAKIFEEVKNIMTPISIVADQIKEAFQGWDQMNAFLSGIQNNVNNTLTLASEAYAHMLIQCGIAVAEKNTHHSVHLLTEAIAKKVLATGTTAAAALESPEFLRFALKRIAQVKKNMKRYTIAFNNGQIPTFTNDADAKLALLTDFTTAAGFTARANTFNANELNIGEYDEVACWQAFSDTSKANFDYSTNSTIKIAADSTNKLGIGTEAVTITDVIGVLYDTRAMGISLTKSKVTSNYTAIADFWNEYHHKQVNYILDPNFNIVTFKLD